MNIKEAGDLLVPLDEYPIVDSSATVLDAVVRLDESRQNTITGKQPYQSVLVADKNGKIIGKVGQFSLLKVMEPRSRVSNDQNALKRAGVSDGLMETALDHFRSFRLDLSEMCLGAFKLPVSMAMTPFVEHVDINSPISDVIHKMLEWRALSVLVTENNIPIGLVRLSDICDAVLKQMQQANTFDSKED